MAPKRNMVAVLFRGKLFRMERICNVAGVSRGNVARVKARLA